MRRQLVKTVTDLLEKDERVVLLLGDIGVFGFREALKKFPTRVYNIGILEQASVSLAAGLASEGMIPFFHTIAPFMVERAFEQLKVDFGYQSLGGNFISVGASYDYSSLGCTHHCPGDVGVLKNIPGMQIFVPGHPLEFDALLRQNYDNSYPSYFRLSERSNEQSWSVITSIDGVIKMGTQGTVIAVGPMLNVVLKACAGLDLTILYRTTITPFDKSTRWREGERNLIIVEPFYQGTLASDLQEFGNEPLRVLYIGVPRRFLTSYGKPEQHDQKYGLTCDQIREKIVGFIK